ncbi:hypothetical protein GOEFS_105_00030 [Gordonia effusa NBRC 100432]|uniref:Uncharacterized protein n=1 Tax=Gordonia effusa NBRC 100432 TaxID=1077974 RepID=H0R4J1_9ACTN|nr:DUF6676 family protein [Gordonia effusa]GAB19992.1 hypothetical protein GOEFS_105_00030 [Gordonia effusa NBRC 100432]
MSPEPIVVGRVGSTVTHLAEPEDPAVTTTPTVPGEDPAASTSGNKPVEGIPYGASVPANVNIEKIRNDLLTTGVSGPADQVPQLKEVVAHAKSKGHDIKIVVLTEKQPKFTYYRDVAIELQSSTGGNVLVLGPNSVGSQGPDFSRVDQEEAAANNLTLTNPPQAARQMVDYLDGPTLDWTAITLVLMAVVFVGAVLARIFGRRRARGGAGAETTPDTPSDGSPEAAERASTETSVDAS